MGNGRSAGTLPHGLPQSARQDTVWQRAIIVTQFNTFAVTCMYSSTTNNQIISRGDSGSRQSTRVTATVRQHPTLSLADLHFSGGFASFAIPSLVLGIVNITQATVGCRTGVQSCVFASMICTCHRMICDGQPLFFAEILALACFSQVSCRRHCAWMQCGTKVASKFD